MAQVAVANSGGGGGGDGGGGGGGCLLKLKRTEAPSVSTTGGQNFRRRINVMEDVDRSPTTTTILQNSKMVDVENCKPGSLKNTRLDEVYPNTKTFSRLRSLCAKLNVKTNAANLSVEECLWSKSSSLPLDSSPICQQEINSHDGLSASTLNAKNNGSQHCHTTEKCSEVRFRSVSELSVGRSDQIASLMEADMMDKALKGFAACWPPDRKLSFDSFGKHGEPRSAFQGVGHPELHVSGRKVPLDLTLKTKMRIVSSSPISWFHRRIMSGTYSCMAPLPTQCCNNHNISGVSNLSSAREDNSPDSLSSWTYPHSSLPPSVISALSIATAGGESDFLSKRQRDWGDAFRNLYYLLRKNACDVFYVCTSQFVVMFTAFGAAGKTKRQCNAYISQSTRGLRLLLKEHDVCFSMPLCLSEVEQTCREDLVELSEIEKINLGQTKRRNLMADVDNSPESLLAFEGNYNTHGLYDFLSNYKYFLTSLNGVDVPVLCAPLPFRNAAPSSPEINCKEIKSVDLLASKFDGSGAFDNAAMAASLGSICYSIEITDRYIAPWTVGSICSAIGYEGRGFEASFTLEPHSLGLNVALDEIDLNANPQESTKGKSCQSYCPLGVNAMVASELRTASIKVLKCSNGDYTASLDPI